MIYPELFKQLEAVRWNMDDDIPWDQFDARKLSEEQAQTIKMNAITEWAALPATELFLRDNRDDSDFSAFMSVWFFAEPKHSLVLLESLARFRRAPLPAERGVPPGRRRQARAQCRSQAARPRPRGGARRGAIP